MPISSYSTTRDTNATITPGDIRNKDPEIQQIINSIRQLMADLAAFYGGGSITIPGTFTADDIVVTDDLTVGDDATVTGDLSAGTISRGSNRIDQWETIRNEIATGQTVYDVPNLGVYDRLRINAVINPNTTDNQVLMRWSSNNGSSFNGTVGDYVTFITYTTEGTPGTPGSNGPGITERVDLSFGSLVEGTNAIGVRMKDMVIDKWNKSSNHKTGQGFIWYLASTGVLVVGSLHFRSGSANTLAAMDALRFSLGAAGTFDIDILLEGQRG